VSLRVVVATKRRDKIRDDLFAAGWKPSMVGQENTSGLIRHLMLRLNAANEAITKAKLSERSR
jgi:hypothetical protein